MQTKPEARSDGERAFRANCQTCHTLPNPRMKSDGDWPKFVQRYGGRAILTQE
jgi:mono/diheme cytochrome c family protein